MFTRLAALKQGLMVRITRKSSIQKRIEASKRGRWFPADPSAPMQIVVGGRPAKPDRSKVPIEEWYVSPVADQAVFMKRMAVYPDTPDDETPE